MYNFKYQQIIKDLFIGTLAVAAGIYVEKKYNVSDRIAEQVRKYTGKDLFDTDNREPLLDID